MRDPGPPPAQGLYDPAHEHDACGVGFVVDIKGRKSHAIVSQALTVLKNLLHRGACGCEVNTGDGAAIFIMQIAGGIVVFGALFVQVAYNPPIWAMLLVALPLVAGLSLGLMRPGKGVMIALQMRNKAGQARNDD